MKGNLVRFYHVCGMSLAVIYPILLILDIWAGYLFRITRYFVVIAKYGNVLKPRFKKIGSRSLESKIYAPPPARDA